MYHPWPSDIGSILLSADIPGWNIGIRYSISAALVQTLCSDTAKQLARLCAAFISGIPYVHAQPTVSPYAPDNEPFYQEC